MTIEIVLPVGVDYVATSEIPRLIAHALIPDAAKFPRTVMYFVKLARNGADAPKVAFDGWPIDDDDRRILADIWTDLPPVPKNATEQQVQPYLNAFAAGSASLDWDLGVSWSDPETMSLLLRGEAARKHESEMKSALRENRLPAVNPSSRLPATEREPDSEVEIQNFIRYVAQFRIAVRFAPFEFDPETRNQLSRAKEWSEKELEALCLGAPPSMCNDARFPPSQRSRVQAAINRAVIDGQLVAEPSGGSDALFGGQWRIDKVSAVRWAVGVSDVFPDWLASAELTKIFALQDEERVAEGRWSLSDAADEFASATGESSNDFLAALVRAVNEKALTVYRPGSKVGYAPATVRPYYEEAYWRDLNLCLDSYAPRIEWRFPPPGVYDNFSLSDGRESTELSPQPIVRANTEAELPAGIPTRDIVDGFRLDVSWHEKLKHVGRRYKYVRLALVRAGSRKVAGSGGSHLWNPAVLGRILVVRGVKSEFAVMRAIKDSFPEWMDVWHAASEDPHVGGE